MRSLLASIVSGQRAGLVAHDAEGRIFIERSARLFPPILAFLQAPGEGVEGVAVEDEGLFKREIAYYGLAEVLYSRAPGTYSMATPMSNGWTEVPLDDDAPFDPHSEYLAIAITEGPREISYEAQHIGPCCAGGLKTKISCFGTPTPNLRPRRNTRSLTPNSVTEITHTCSNNIGQLTSYLRGNLLTIPSCSVYVSNASRRWSLELLHRMLFRADSAHQQTSSRFSCGPHVSKLTRWA
jgi:hypothetical protein